MPLPQITMECRAVDDPELRFAPSGMAVAKVRVVADKKKRNDAGEWVDDKTFWCTVTCFKEMAEHLAESVSKGDEMIVTGTIQTDSWEDRTTGEKRSAPSILAYNIGPSLRWRDVRIAPKAERASAAAPADDPWATPAPSANPAAAPADDPWGSEPPF